MIKERLIRLKSVDKLVSNGITEVLVTYANKSTKLFTLENWVIFRKGIITNLYNKNLCQIDFVKS